MEEPALPLPLGTSQSGLSRYDPTLCYQFLRFDRPMIRHYNRTEMLLAVMNLFLAVLAFAALYYLSYPHEANRVQP